MSPSRKRAAVDHLEETFEVSERRACKVVELPRATCRYQSVMVEDPQLLKDLRELAAERPRFGYRRLHLMLKRKGWTINHKLVYRLYRQEGLAVRRRIRKRIAGNTRSMPHDRLHSMMERFISGGGTFPVIEAPPQHR